MRIEDTQGRLQQLFPEVEVALQAVGRDVYRLRVTSRETGFTAASVVLRGDLDSMSALVGIVDRLIGLLTRGPGSDIITAL